MKTKTAGLLVSALMWTGTVWGEPTVVNGVLAIVNDSIITLKDVNRAIEPDLRYYRAQFASRPDLFEKKLRDLQKEMIDALVEKELILHEFKTGGYNPLPETYIDNKISEDIRKNYGDQLSLNKTLQARGLTFEQYRDQVRERVVLQLMWQHNVPQDPIVSPHKVELYYQSHLDDYKVEDQVKVQLIEVPRQPLYSGFDPLEMMKEIQTKLAGGAQFSEMAAVYSSSSAWSGEWIGRSVLRQELSDKAFSLKPGETSGVIETPNAYYLLEVEDYRPAHTRALSDVRDEITAKLKSDEKNRLREQWINRLKKKSYVRFF